MSSYPTSSTSNSADCGCSTCGCLGSKVKGFLLSSLQSITRIIRSKSRSPNTSGSGGSSPSSECNWSFYSYCLPHVMILFLAGVFISWNTIQKAATTSSSTVSTVPPLQQGNQWHWHQCDQFRSGSNEDIWRIVSTAILVPLLIETMLEWIVISINPTLSNEMPISSTSGKDSSPTTSSTSAFNSYNNKNNRVEDRLGHTLIIFSLIPSSYLPIWALGSHGCVVRDVFVSFGHGLLVYGILGKIETFSNDLWNVRYPILVMTLYTISQLCFILGLENHSTNLDWGSIWWFSDMASDNSVMSNDETKMVFQYDSMAVKVGASFKIISAILFLVTSYRIPWRYWMDDLTLPKAFSFLRHNQVSHANTSPTNTIASKQSVSFLTTRKYLCTILWLSLSLFMTRNAWFFWKLLQSDDLSGERVQDDDQDNLLAFRIYMQVALVIATAVLPGRVMRRGIAAWQRSLLMEKEMNYKKTFVRYVSHEIR